MSMSMLMSMSIFYIYISIRHHEKHASIMENKLCLWLPCWSRYTIGELWPNYWWSLMTKDTPYCRDHIQIQIQNCLLVNQRAQVLPMYKNNTQQYKHTHIHKNDETLSFMLIINARSVITTHVQDTTQAQKSATWNYNMIYMMTSHCLYDIIHNISATIQC